MSFVQLAPRQARRIYPAFFSLFLICAGCVHAPLNAPLDHYDPVGGYRFHPQATGTMNSQLAVFLFFSGGGTRAAAFSYGVLEELARTPVPGDRRLLDHVATIFAVSGGSFTAAYYCLYGDRTFRDFEPEFLKRDVQDALIWRCLNPAITIKLLSPYFARSDMAAEYYDGLLFHGATFADLSRNDRQRPYLIINATDMVTNTHIEFTQDVFDVLDSDLASYPIARAVAATTAAPILFSPITLKNYAGRGAPPASFWLHPDAAWASYARQQSDIAAQAQGYLDARKRPFIHLLDGGLVDNLGLSDLFAIVTMRGGWENLMRHAHLGPSARIAIIVVNAATESKPQWSESEKTPSILDVISATSTGAIGRFNGENSELVQESIAAWRREAAASAEAKAAAAGARPRIYFIGVNFHQLASPEERQYFNSLPTRFKLSGESVDRLVDAGGRILRESAEFQKLLSDLAPAR